MVVDSLAACRETFERLDDYLDRRLAPHERAAVENHLAHCVRCTHEFRFEERLVGELRARLSRLEVPRGLPERIARVLDALTPEAELSPEP